MEYKRVAGCIPLEARVVNRMELPRDFHIVGLTAKASHYKFTFSIIADGNNVIAYGLPGWILSRLWLPLDIDPISFASFVLNIIPEKRLEIEVWIAQKSEGRR
jgi:hypothetical protein